MQALVDTGATFLTLPASLAKELGTPKVSRRQKVSLADGSVKRLPETIVSVRFDGREAASVALIVPKGEVLLGVEPLEALGLVVDPVRERLIPKRPYGVRLGGYRRL